MKDRKNLGYKLSNDVFCTRDDFSALNESRIITAFGNKSQRKIRKRIHIARILGLFPFCHLHVEGKN